VKHTLSLLVFLAVSSLAQQWDFEVVDSGGVGNYVAIDRASDGTLWLAYVSADSTIRLAHKDSVWVFEDLDTAVVRPIPASEPTWGDQPFAFGIGPGDVLGVVGLGRLAEYRVSVWSSEELPMRMRMPKFAYDPACRPSITFADDLWQGCLAVRTDSGWDTSVVFHDPSGCTWWFSLSRPAWCRNQDCAITEADMWQMPGIDGYGVGLYMRDSGIWTASAFIMGLDGGGRGFAALADCDDSIHAFWSASDPYGTNRLVCDGVWLDSFTSIGAACLDTAGRVQCAWTGENRLRFAVLGKPTWDVGDAGGIEWCEITTDTLSQPVIAYWRDGRIGVSHGVDIVGQAEESQEPTVHGLQPTASVVRSVLFLGAGHDPNRSGFGPCPRPVLLDATGRKVMDLHSGANDVRALSPGVYFVREAQAQAQAQAQAVRKVVITR
jgi:hypothetical protein